MQLRVLRERKIIGDAFKCRIFLLFHFLEHLRLVTPPNSIELPSSWAILHYHLINLLRLLLNKWEIRLIMVQKEERTEQTHVNVSKSLQWSIKDLTKFTIVYINSGNTRKTHFHASFLQLKGLQMKSWIINYSQSGLMPDCWNWNATLWKYLSWGHPLWKGQWYNEDMGIEAPVGAGNVHKWFWLSWLLLSYESTMARIFCLHTLTGVPSSICMEQSCQKFSGQVDQWVSVKLSIKRLSLLPPRDKTTHSTTQLTCVQLTLHLFPN